MYVEAADLTGWGLADTLNDWKICLMRFIRETRGQYSTRTDVYTHYTLHMDEYVWVDESGL